MGSPNSEKHHMLSLMLEPSFGIPTDVTFKIMGFKHPEFENSQENEVLLGEVTGHRVILALLSPVFRRGFFGPATDSEDTVPVRQTTLEAFKLMIEYVYNKDIDWSRLPVLELYDVVNLAEKYDIPGLMEQVKTQMEKITLTMEDVVDVYDTAAQFTQFPTVSDPLILKCVNFLQENLGTSKELLAFAVKQSGSGQEVNVLKMLVIKQQHPK